MAGNRISVKLSGDSNVAKNTVENNKKYDKECQCKYTTQKTLKAIVQVKYVD